MTTPEPVSPAPDTEALRQQVRMVIRRHLPLPTTGVEAEAQEALFQGIVHFAAEREAGLRADLDRTRGERDALSRMLRGMARRVGEVRDEMRFATVHIGQWQKVAQRLRSQRDSARVSGARPIPDDEAERGTAQ